MHRICAQERPSVLAEVFQQNQLGIEIWQETLRANLESHTLSESDNQKHLITITISSNPYNEKKSLAISKIEIDFGILTTQF